MLSTISLYVLAALAYVKAHPEQVVYVALTIAVAVVKRTKMMTPEQFAAMPRPLAYTVKMLAAVLPDVVKLAKVVSELKHGGDPLKIPVDVEEPAPATLPSATLPVMLPSGDVVHVEDEPATLPRVQAAPPAGGAS